LPGLFHQSWRRKYSLAEAGATWIINAISMPNLLESFFNGT
jgi:hypothetical protein